MNQQPTYEIQEPTVHHTVFNPPSRCVFYQSGVDSLHVRRFGLDDLDAMSTAKNASNMVAMIKAIGNTITAPIEMLTQDDFQALCFWHRINSFPRRPLTFTWECGNPNHIMTSKLEITPDMDQKKRDEIDDARRFLKNRQVLTGLSNISSTPMDLSRFNKLKAFYRDKERYTYPTIFVPPTVATMMEFAELTSIQMKNAKLQELELDDTNLEIALEELASVTSNDIILRVASCLPPTCGLTLVDRMEFLRKDINENRDKYGSEFLDDLDKFEELSEHSISEIVKGKCKFGGCGQAIDLPIEFDLFNFFPHV